MAHILGASSQRPRGDEPLDDREGNKHTNLIPLYPTHHTIINDQLRTYSVIVLRQMKANHRRLPFSASLDKNAAYPEAFSTSQEEKIPPSDCKLRRVKYLHNVIEPDHRFIKKKVRASQCFKRFHIAEQTFEGIESMNRMRKGQVKRLSGSDAQGQAKLVLYLSQSVA